MYVPFGALDSMVYLTFFVYLTFLRSYVLAIALFNLESSVVSLRSDYFVLTGPTLASEFDLSVPLENHTTSFHVVPPQ